MRIVGEHMKIWIKHSKMRRGQQMTFQYSGFCTGKKVKIPVVWCSAGIMSFGMDRGLVWSAGPDFRAGSQVMCLDGRTGTGWMPP